MEQVTLNEDRISALYLAFQRNGWSAEEVDTLIDDAVLDRVREVVVAKSPACVEQEWPVVPDGWSVESHVFHPPFKWRPEAVSLHFEDDQLSRGGISSGVLRRRLGSKPALNASVLDFLLENPHLIPMSWRSVLVHFWGTVYRDPSGHRCVRHLRWEAGRWQSGRTWLGGEDVGFLSPAALLVDDGCYAKIEDDLSLLGLTTLPDDERRDTIPDVFFN